MKERKSGSDKMMKLSEALELGRTIVKPIAGQEWAPDGSGCARGMALEAIGLRSTASFCQDLAFYDCWPWTTQPKQGDRVYCPGCLNYSRSNYARIIAHIFDHHIMGAHDWAMDQLISWVRSVEPAEHKQKTEKEEHAEEECNIAQ
jgi:hypothetical protein